MLATHKSHPSTEVVRLFDPARQERMILIPVPENNCRAVPVRPPYGFTCHHCFPSLAPVNRVAEVLCVVPTATIDKQPVRHIGKAKFYPILRSPVFRGNGIPQSIVECDDSCIHKTNSPSKKAISRQAPRHIRPATAYPADASPDSIQSHSVHPAASCTTHF